MERPLHPILALIPARGGSKGLPGKNIRVLAGLPLIAHSIKFALSCPQVQSVLCSTDSHEIADVARAHGAEVPFLRPEALASDTAPMWGVVQHALKSMEDLHQIQFGSILLLDPTSPGRILGDVESAIEKLAGMQDADGVVGVSEPNFNPIWHCVLEQDGVMTDLMPEARKFHRRQDVPRVFRINGSLYLWRRDFVLSSQNWREGQMLIQEMPESRTVLIDSVEDFKGAVRAVEDGRISFPWAPLQFGRPPRSQALPD